jgi:hypothetical protein
MDRGNAEKQKREMNFCAALPLRISAIGLQKSVFTRNLRINLLGNALAHAKTRSTQRIPVAHFQTCPASLCGFATWREILFRISAPPRFSDGSSKCFLIYRGSAEGRNSGRLVQRSGFEAA